MTPKSLPVALARGVLLLVIPCFRLVNSHFFTSIPLQLKLEAKFPIVCFGFISYNLQPCVGRIYACMHPTRLLGDSFIDSGAYNCMNANSISLPRSFHIALSSKSPIVFVNVP